MAGSLLLYSVDTEKFPLGGHSARKTRPREITAGPGPSSRGERVPEAVTQGLQMPDACSAVNNDPEDPRSLRTVSCRSTCF